MKQRTVNKVKKLYDYSCSTCGNEQELYCLFSKYKSINCPTCGMKTKHTPLTNGGLGYRWKFADTNPYEPSCVIGEDMN